MISPYIDDQLFIGTTYPQSGGQPYNTAIAPGEVSVVTAADMKTIKNNGGSYPNNDGKPFCFVKNVGKVGAPEFIVSSIFSQKYINDLPVLLRYTPMQLFIYQCDVVSPLLEDRYFQYLIRFLVKSPEQKHQYIDVQVLHKSPAGGASAGLITLMVNAVNNHPYISTYVTATAASNYFLISEKSDYINNYDINGKEEFRRFDCDITIMRNELYNALFPVNDRFSGLPVNYTRKPVAGVGNWQQVASEERRYLGRSGITNTTEFPVIIPKPVTEKGAEYGLVEIINNKPYRDASNKLMDQINRVKVYIRRLAADSDALEAWMRFSRQLQTVIKIV